MYSDAEVAGLYDVMNPWDGTRFAGDAFYTDPAPAPSSTAVRCATAQYRVTSTA